MKLRCITHNHLVCSNRPYLTPGKVYEVVRDETVFGGVIIDDDGDEVWIYLKDSSHGTFTIEEETQ